MHVLVDQAAEDGFSVDPFAVEVGTPGGLKPVTNQVTTGSDGARPTQTQPDIAIRLTSRYQTQRDIAGRNRQAWHARGLEFESP